ncbi:MAG TPA: dienelactone hydrolase family protein, partial [Candidatus Melainabacteria bacterium]|nr:dienelactone hydrolase family protein [Candidatus Melainabacteria bacterium]
MNSRIKTEYLDYTDGGESFEAYVAYDAAAVEKGAERPCILVSHAWGGQSDFEREKAEKLAALGYVGFALDIYGKGKRGSTMEENAKLMQPYVDDRK